MAKIQRNRNQIRRVIMRMPGNGPVVGSPHTEMHNQYGGVLGASQELCSLILCTEYEGRRMNTRTLLKVLENI